MYGAIIGDLAGSIYEYDQLKELKGIKGIEQLITDDSFYSDDTILTIAVADAILNNCDYDSYLKKYGNEFIKYRPNIKKYFDKPFSPGFVNWIEGKSIGNSRGNGALMRISPVGYMFNTLEEVKANAISATIPSHNSKDSIDSAILVSSIIFLARQGCSKEKIIDKLNIKLRYSPFTKFNSECRDTIDNCLYAAFNANTFEESIKLVLSYGGDTDTNACIVGSIAEALYGIEDVNLINKVNEKIPNSFVKVLKRSYSYKISKV